MNLLKEKPSNSSNGETKVLNYKKYLAEIFLAVGIIAIICIIPFSSKIYATEEFWALNIGDETVAVLNSESDVNAAIELVKNNYVKEGASDVSVEFASELTAQQKFYHSDEVPTVLTSKEAADLILTGTEEVIKYTVKDGDTLWSISEDNKIDLNDLMSVNGLKESSVIKAGDEVSLTAMQPLVDVTTVQTVTSVQTINFNTKYENNANLAEGTTKVKTEGKNGKKEVTETLTSVNGKVTITEVLDSKVVQEPTTKVVYKGTKKPVQHAAASNGGSGYSSGSSSYADASTFAGDGAGIANFALQFVGNPYVYGGSSLTNGADCSGFVMAVYAHFGISLPHDAGADRSYGRGVSLSEARPGDLVCYYGHVGIYIGGGRLVHAKDYGYGICVDNVHYSSKPIMTIRRIVE